MKKHLLDPLERVVAIPKAPLRIVSLVPSLSELVVGLGLEAQLLGITKFCIAPAHLKKTKAIVGGTKQVHLDKIAALQPNIILANKEENTQEMVSKLEGIAPVYVSDINTIEDMFVLLQDLGILLQYPEKAKELANELRQKLQQFAPPITQATVAYCIWKDPYMVAAKDTFIHSILQQIGFRNSYASQIRYPSVALSELQALQPQYVLLSTEPYPFTQAHVNELQAQLPHSKVLLVNGTYFSWYSQRLITALDYFQTLFKA